MPVLMIPLMVRFQTESPWISKPYSITSFPILSVYTNARHKNLPIFTHWWSMRMVTRMNRSPIWFVRDMFHVCPSIGMCEASICFVPKILTRSMAIRVISGPEICSFPGARYHGRPNVVVIWHSIIKPFLTRDFYSCLIQNNEIV